MLELNTLSVEELKALLPQISAELAQRRHEAVRVAQAKVLAAIEESELSRAEVLGPLLGRQPPKKREPVSQGYQNPDNPQQIWLGLGKRPGWLKRQLAAGKSLTDFAVML
jgi:DNA-binding protein H-NS